MIFKKSNPHTTLKQLYDKFFFELPETLDEFKKEFIRFFPVVYDTKFLMSSSQILSKLANNNTTLRNSFEGLFKYGSDLPALTLGTVGGGENNNYQLTVEKEDNVSHEAGYDSFMTAATFINGLKVLGIAQYLPQSEAIGGKLEYFKNKIPLWNMSETLSLTPDAEQQTKQKSQLFYCQSLQRDKLKVKQKETSSLLGNRSKNENDIG